MNSFNKKNIIILSIILIVIIIISVIYTVKQNSSQVVIGNYDKFIKSLPQDRKLAINSTLSNIIKSSSSDIKISTSSATIREKSYTEVYNKSEKTYSSTFIVDIPDIKQSYKVLFIWSKDSSVVLKGDDLIFSCLTKEQLIYGNFNCSKILNTPELNSDPILQFLPYSTFNYTITVGPISNAKMGLNINIYLYLSDTRDGNGDKAIDQYKNEAINWIKLKNLNIDNYSINYIINQ